MGSIVISKNELPLRIVTDWDIVSDGILLSSRIDKSLRDNEAIHTIESEESITEAACFEKNNIKRLGVIYKEIGWYHFGIRCHRSYARISGRIRKSRNYQVKLADLLPTHLDIMTNAENGHGLLMYSEAFAWKSVEEIPPSNRPKYVVDSMFGGLARN